MHQNVYGGEFTPFPFVGTFEFVHLFIRPLAAFRYIARDVFRHITHDTFVDIWREAPVVRALIVRCAYVDTAIPARVTVLTLVAQPSKRTRSHVDSPLASLLLAVHAPQVYDAQR